MSELTTEFTPLTSEQEQAIIACRWSTTTGTRTFVYLWTDQEEIKDTLEPVLTGFEHYCRDWKTRKYEWEMRSVHPDVIRIVKTIMAGRKALAL